MLKLVKEVPHKLSLVVSRFACTQVRESCRAMTMSFFSLIQGAQAEQSRSVARVSTMRTSNTLRMNRVGSTVIYTISSIISSNIYRTFIDGSFEASRNSSQLFHLPSLSTVPLDSNRSLGLTADQLTSRLAEVLQPTCSRRHLRTTTCL